MHVWRGVAWRGVAWRVLCYETYLCACARCGWSRWPRVCRLSRWRGKQCSTTHWDTQWHILPSSSRCVSLEVAPCDAVHHGVCVCMSRACVLLTSPRPHLVRPHCGCAACRSMQCWLAQTIVGGNASGTKCPSHTWPQGLSAPMEGHQHQRRQHPPRDPRVADLGACGTVPGSQRPAQRGRGT